MKLLQKDIFGNILIIKKVLIIILGCLSYRRFNGINNLKIKGSEIIKKLPKKNVLFISNHQTYFADATAMIHVFNSSLNGGKNTLRNLIYLFKPKLNIYFIAAKETMSSGWLPKILAYTGAISIGRTWRENGKEIKREVNNQDIDNVNLGLKSGWVITFPQGTTKPWSPVRKGTAHIIKHNKPIVVPIKIDGFRRSFDKTGLFIKKKNINQIMTIKKPLLFDYENSSIDDIVKKITIAIEQEIEKK